MSTSNPNTNIERLRAITADAKELGDKRRADELKQRRDEESERKQREEEARAEQITKAAPDLIDAEARKEQRRAVVMQLTTNDRKAPGGASSAVCQPEWLVGAAKIVYAWCVDQYGSENVHVLHEREKKGSAHYVFKIVVSW